MSTNAEAGPSTNTVPPQKIKGKKGQAGGTGKKGKKFVEDKSALLSLISDVTSSKDSVRDSKLAKHRSFNPQTEVEPIEIVGGKRVKVAKVVTPSEKRRKEKNRALAEAKVTIAAKAKEKKRRRTEEASTTPSSTTKKRVGFA